MSENYTIRKIQIPKVEFAQFGSIHLDETSANQVRDVINSSIDKIVKLKSGDNQTIADICADSVEESLRITMRAGIGGVNRSYIYLFFNLNLEVADKRWKKIRIDILREKPQVPRINLGTVIGFVEEQSSSEKIEMTEATSGEIMRPYKCG